MLSPKELEDYFDRAKLFGAAVEVINRIRSSHPQRRVASGKSNVASRFSSKKMGLVIQAESHNNELPAVISWEFDENTYEFWDQPQGLKISYLGEKGWVTHTTVPDYFLLQEDFTGWVECKTEQELQQKRDSGSQLFTKDEQGNWRCPAGEAAAAKFGLQFMVRSSADNNTTFVRNMVFLADYMDARCPAVPESDAKSILEIFEKDAWHEVKVLIDAGYKADHIYKLIADQRLHFDVHNQLLARTHLTVIFRDSSAAAALQLHIQSQNDSSKNSAVINLDPGESFIWDGVVWTIVNRGDKSLYIRNSDNIYQDLKYSTVCQLVADGTITGLNKGNSGTSRKVEEILRSASPDSHKRATERYHQIFLDDPSQVTVSERSLRRWKQMYRDAELVYGYGYIGLLSTVVNRGNRNSKIEPRVREIANEVINEFYLKPNGRSATACWGEVELRCSEEGLTPLSEKSFLAHIKKLCSNDVKTVREGAKAAYSKSPFIWYLEQTTPRHGDRVFEIGHIDHTELDLQLVDSKYGSNLGKVWLTVLLDAHTRMVLAWVLSYESPSYRSCMAVIQSCVKRHNRVPKFFVIDQGSEFRSVYFESLLARLESHKKERPGSKPRFGSVIERFFGVNNQTFIHNLQGHNKALQNPRVLSGSHDPRKLAVWTLPTFKLAFQSYIENAYSKMEHAALGVSPETAMAISLDQSGHRLHKLIPHDDQFTVMCWPSTPKRTAKVDPSRGVKIGYIYYWTPEFRNTRFANRQVEVRYDPYNKAYATAWLDDHWVPCVSQYKEVFEGLTEKQINDATQELRARLKKEPIRRAINAQILAAFFRDITKTEQGLTEQLRHLDSMDTSTLPMVASALPMQLKDLNPVETENIWANINTRILGEFEL